MSGIVARSAQWQIAGGGSVPAFGGASRAFSNHRVEFGDITALSGISAASMAVWMYRSSTSHRVAAGCNESNNNNRFTIFWNSDSLIYLNTNDGTSNAYSRLSYASTGWTHLVMVFDAGTHAIYQDGTLMSPTAFGTLPSALGSGTGDNMVAGRLGARTDVATTGNIADFRVYSDALTTAEVSDIYGGTHVSDSLELWAFLDSDDVLDASGNGNDGTNYGSTYSTDGPLDP